MFVWEANLPRISIKTLVKSKSKGRVGLSYPELYHRAVHLSRVADWCCNGQSKLWVLIELAGSPVWLPGASWTEYNPKIAPAGSALVAYVFKMVGLAYRKANLISYPLPFLPILGHPRFLMSMDLLTFRDLIKQNCFRAYDFMVNNDWSVPADLDLESLEYTIYPNSYWGIWCKPNQAHFLATLPPNICFDRQLTIVEQICIRPTITKGSPFHISG